MSDMETDEKIDTTDDTEKFEFKFREQEAKEAKADLLQKIKKKCQYYSGLLRMGSYLTSGQKYSPSHDFFLDSSAWSQGRGPHFAPNWGREEAQTSAWSQGRGPPFAPNWGREDAQKHVSVCLRTDRCDRLIPPGKSLVYNWEELISFLVSLLVTVPVLRSPRVEDLPDQRNRYLLSSTIFESISMVGTGFLHGLSCETPFPDLETQWVKEWEEQRKQAGGYVFWGLVGVRGEEDSLGPKKYGGHAMAYRLDMDLRSVEVFDSEGWNRDAQGAYQSLFAAGTRFLRRGAADGLVRCYFVNPFKLPHEESCGLWTSTYLILRETLGWAETMNFFLNASGLYPSKPEGNIRFWRKSGQRLSYQLPGGDFESDEIEEEFIHIGGLGRAFFLCNSRVWRLCYTLTGWTSRGEKTARMLRNTEAIMRVICGCQTYEDVREALQQCLTPVAPFLPQAFLESAGIPFDAETSVIAREGSSKYLVKADARYLWRWTGWFEILTWALENKYTAILSALLYRARGTSFKSHPSYDQVEVLVEKTEDPEIIDMAKVFWHEEISRKNKLEIPISQSEYENPN